MKNQITALALFSGGLDSILAARVVAAQNIRVIAVKFVSPFFDHPILDAPEEYKKRIQDLYGLEVMVEDISEQYLRLLRQPAYGFGKNFNPCVDCKIFMFERARGMMEEVGASFLISGEVLGQRPMSQRRDTLNVIERDSGSRDILLRPLSAKLLRPTEAEKQGLVHRDKLLDFSGRGRSRQIALAREFGITEFPAPAGGCRLADPILSKRIARVYAGEFVIAPDIVDSSDILCLMTGRQFLLPGGGWLVLGRDEQDNRMLERLKKEDDVLICLHEHPGPTALLRRTALLYDSPASLDADRKLAMALVVRYAKKVDGRRSPQVVQVHDHGDISRHWQEPIDGQEYMAWML